MQSLIDGPPTLNADDIKFDLMQIVDCIAEGRPVVIYGRTNYTGDTEKIRYKSGGDIDRTVYPYTSLPFGDYSFEDDINNMNSGRS